MMKGLGGPVLELNSKYVGVNSGIGTIGFLKDNGIMEE